MKPEDAKAIDDKLRSMGVNPERISIIEADCRTLAGGHVEITITGDPQKIACVPAEKLLDVIFGALAPHVPRKPT